MFFWCFCVTFKTRKIFSLDYESFTQGESVPVEKMPLSVISNHILLLMSAHLIIFSEQSFANKHIFGRCPIFVKLEQTTQTGYCIKVSAPVR